MEEQNEEYSLSQFIVLTLIMGANGRDNGCGKNVQRSGLETHLTDNCPKQIVNCQYCGQGGTRGLITGSSHLSECHNLPIKCGITGYHEKIPRHTIASHWKSCPKRFVFCKYKTVCCKAFIMKEEHESHNARSLKEHLDMAMQKLSLIDRSQNERSRILHLSWGIQDEVECGLQRMQYIALGTHVSCHIYPMEGEYDDTLEWHFQGKVTIKLLNQLEDKNHSKLTILLNADDGMERVREGCSLYGWGSMHYISHEELEYNPVNNCQYLKDDSLYFRVSVKATSQTKPWLT
ncbi:PREDICTED: TNF receptor-associated factor 4-like [Amphimedon queenslandica]|uniref:TRAF-type domain-containing protein n=1 Tax=Amphimedon queenslandica TaxID=400682 RepID=A0AAN0IRJ9_AMPQE|nr:PREDICTED: TNF receptor-associated factor 4-like [Amphimedon queenslandica]|eukprot:XP_011407240.1 PREDICTED: TNF receptor-associated factor 4-like [Amphimedon queenslandica]